MTPTIRTDDADIKAAGPNPALAPYFTIRDLRWMVEEARRYERLVRQLSPAIETEGEEL